MEGEQFLGGDSDALSLPHRGVYRCMGPRAVEEVLLKEVAQYQEALASDPRLLQKPILIIVSSDFLRQRVLVRLSQYFKAPLLGVRVATMTSVASELCRGQGSLAQGSRLLPLLI